MALRDKQARSYAAIIPATWTPGLSDRILSLIPSEHIEAVLLAGAAGDCIGLPYEGHGPTDTVELPADPWQCSDDTILTLATCRGIIAAGGVDPAAIAAAYAETFRRGPIPGLGASTLKALRDLAAGAHWGISGRGGEYAAGNGAAMRIAPLAFLMSGEGQDERQLIRDVCRITHKSDEAYVGALAVVRAMHLIAEPGLDAPGFVARIAGELPDTRVRDALLALAELPADAGNEEAAALTGTGGHAAESVPLALFVAARSRHSCEETILAAVRCGGDTDTIASIAGQVCAAGGAAIPSTWTTRLPVLVEIQALAQGLRELAGR